ncbi:LysR family transcriptional regulator [Undibacterium sp. CY18W]|uniref:LysR family transcriptional regulator n=1 Tax=Undibacterium hunanense TaxID=2762292 RepID=A0ABR6ZXL2_9BURK|nr:LysR family transcriptional regulator [Undibacterium hunanense]MBC3920602.1 LysR family transcriptional regulator [Undibacterium hunanense]
MNLTDLKIFACVARQPSLGAAAQELHLTPSAVSKALRRLEADLDTLLFDRSAKQLSLNAGGQRMLEFARNMLSMADQMKADMGGERASFACKIAGPAVLLWRHAQQITQAMSSYGGVTLQFDSLFEEDALAALERGEASAAMVTGEVINGRSKHWQADWQTIQLGALDLQLLAGYQHPLARRDEKGQIPQLSAAQVLECDFVSPSRSLFCGERRGGRSDGWRDDQLPRKIRYWIDDLQLLLMMVKSGKALAYLPDFALNDLELVRLEVSDCGFQCREEVCFVWNARNAPVWLNNLACTLSGKINTNAKFK